MKRRKLRVERKEQSIRIRLTDEQKATMTDAASAAGLDLSGWIRFLALREAQKHGRGN